MKSRRTTSRCMSEYWKSRKQNRSECLSGCWMSKGNGTISQDHISRQRPLATSEQSATEARVGCDKANQPPPATRGPKQETETKGGLNDVQKNLCPSSTRQ